MPSPLDAHPRSLRAARLTLCSVAASCSRWRRLTPVCLQLFMRARKWPAMRWEAYAASALMEWRHEAKDTIPRNIFELGLKSHLSRPGLVLAYAQFLLGEPPAGGGGQVSPCPIAARHGMCAGPRHRLLMCCRRQLQGAPAQRDPYPSPQGCLLFRAPAARNLCSARRRPALPFRPGGRPQHPRPV